MKFYNGKKVVGLYHRGHKVLYQYHRGRLVYSGEDPYAYGGYVKEGLVLQLDCRQKLVDGGRIALKDLIGNVNWWIHEGGFQEDGGFFGGCHVEQSYEIPDFSQGCTFEVFAKQIKSDADKKGDVIPGTSQVLAMLHKYIIISYDDYNRGTYVVQDLNDNNSYKKVRVGDYDCFINKTFSVSCTDNDAVIDGISLSDYQDYGDRPSDFDVIDLQRIEIYSIRVYNRVLTQKEREHNYAMDKKNFDHSVPSNAVTLQGGEPLKYANGDYVTYKK